MLFLVRLLLHFVVTRILLEEVLNLYHDKHDYRQKCMHGIPCARFHIELIHDQLPLAVPCYDLLPVTESTLVLDKLSLWVPPAPLS